MPRLRKKNPNPDSQQWTHVSSGQAQRHLENAKFSRSLQPLRVRLSSFHFARETRWGFLHYIPRGRHVSQVYILPRRYLFLVTSELSFCRLPEAELPIPSTSLKTGGCRGLSEQQVLCIQPRRQPFCLPGNVVPGPFSRLHYRCDGSRRTTIPSMLRDRKGNPGRQFHVTTHYGFPVSGPAVWWLCVIC